MNKYDVVGIGNAIVDVVIEVSDKTLGKFDLEKGTMHLVGAEESSYIFKQLEEYDKHLASGGSVANSLVNLSALDETTVFIGVVGDDTFGEYFTNDLHKARVGTEIHITHENITGRAIALITPDGERTFATYIGAADQLTPDIINKNVIENCKILYLEGYLLDSDSASDACLVAAENAHTSGAAIAVDMSNVSIVRQHHDVLQELIESYASIVFANADEARAYTGEDPHQALDDIARACEIAVVTMSEKGSLIKAEGQTHRILGIPADPFVNTNGAGDMYAAGVLHGILRQLPLEKAGKIGSFLASQVVSHHDARLPQEYVKDEYKRHFGNI